MEAKLKDLSIALRLLALGVLIFSLAYSGIIGIIGQALWGHEAEGSLIRNEEGEVIGSELIGQEFTSPEYFHGRPSSIDYNAMKSGSQNLGPQEDILFTVENENYREKLDLGVLPNDIRENFEEIGRSLPEGAKVVKMRENEWRIRGEEEDLYSIRTGDNELEFYRRSELARRVENLLEDISSKYDNEMVPTDLVTESGSALDPHITVRSALFQIPRVHDHTGIPKENLRALIEKHSKDKLFGLYGLKRVNVLKLNREIKRIMEGR